ncbi:MAG: lytic transglycosylase domain-containing protein [Fimbriimonadaceae bacterium]
MIGNAAVSNLPVGSGGVAPLDPFGPGMGLDAAGPPGVSSRSAFRIPTAPPALAPLIARAAQSAGIDPGLLDAVVAVESSYDPNARSRAGAMGLAQLMPATAAELGVRNPFDPAENLFGGARYLSQMLARFGDVRTALAAYNAGPGAVERAGGIPDYRETQRYVDRVLEIYQARSSG